MITCQPEQYTALRPARICCMAWLPVRAPRAGTKGSSCISFHSFSAPTVASVYSIFRLPCRRSTSSCTSTAVHSAPPQHCRSRLQNGRIDPFQECNMRGLACQFDHFGYHDSANIEGQVPKYVYRAALTPPTTFSQERCPRKIYSTMQTQMMQTKTCETNKQRTVGQISKQWARPGSRGVLHPPICWRGQTWGARQKCHGHCTGNRCRWHVHHCRLSSLHLRWETSLHFFGSSLFKKSDKALCTGQLDHIKHQCKR